MLDNESVLAKESSNGLYTVSNLSPGTYFVKSDEGIVKKVVVE